MKMLHMAKELILKSQRLSFREKQLSTMEQLPASEIDRFVSQQENTAAVAIQAWWMGRLACAKCRKLHNSQGVQVGYRERIDGTKRREKVIVEMITYYLKLKGQRGKHYKERLPNTGP